MRCSPTLKPREGAERQRTDSKRVNHRVEEDAEARIGVRARANSKGFGASTNSGSGSGPPELHLAFVALSLHDSMIVPPQLEEMMPMGT